MNEAALVLAIVKIAQELFALLPKPKRAGARQRLIEALQSEARVEEDARAVLKRRLGK